MLVATAIMLGIAACGDKDEPTPGLPGDGIIVKSEVSLSSTTPQTLNIKAPATPTVSAEATWLHIGTVNSGAAGIYSVELQAEPNPEASSRTTDLTITAGAHKATVKVTQNPGETISITSVEPSETLLPNGGELTIKYTSSSKPKAETPEWMTVKEQADGSMTLRYGANFGEKREGTVILTVTPSVKAEVKVSQEKIQLPQEMGSTAKELAAKMYAGINIGNTLEPPNGEGSWSPRMKEEYIAGLKAIGFNAVRIPCAWDSHVSNPADNTIDAAWLDRVDEVVGYVVANGMYAILNIHWDGGWLENTCKDGWDANVDKKQRDYWTQIATRLNHYDEHLLLAAMNEPNHTDDNSTRAIMRYQQTMLDAVRATGGNNATRVLVMQAPNTNNDIAVQGVYGMPDDVVADRLMVETHFYSPYQFNMMEKDESWGKQHYYWGAGNHVEGSDRNSNHEWEEDYVRAQMQQMKEYFVDKGVPGIIGEYAVCTNRENTPGIDKDKWRASVTLWNRVVTRESKNAGLVPFFWETGNDISRSDGSIKNSLQLDGVFQGAEEGKYPF